MLFFIVIYIIYDGFYLSIYGARFKKSIFIIATKIVNCYIYFLYNIKCMEGIYMYSHTNMNKISINHSTREKGYTICHVKRRSISSDFVLISTLNGNWYVSYWLITLTIDGRLVLCYISKRKHEVFVSFREATHGGSIISVGIFYFFISFLIFGAVSTPIFPFFALTRNYSGKKTEGSKRSSETYCRYKVHSCAVLGRRPHTNNFSTES